MFYIHNVNEWLEEVIENCNANSLDPEDSVFMLLIFSSLDFDYVEFFRTRRKQISKFSGKNFHIFTPTVFDNVVPDDEWRDIITEFGNAGVSISLEPSALFFNLKKRLNETGFAPRFFAGFRCPEFPEFPRVLRNLVEVGLRNRRNESVMIREFSEILNAYNIIESEVAYNQVTWAVQETLSAPKYFVSYAHADHCFVENLHHRLREHRVDVWLDREELRPGMELTKEISMALRSCDGLIAVLSKNSIEAKWLQYEGSFFSGAEEEKPIIPVVLDEHAKKSLSDIPFIRDRLYLDFTGSQNDERFSELADAIRNPRYG